MSAVVPVKHLFKSKRRDAIPEVVPVALRGYPASVDVPADCDGERSGCAWNTPFHLMPELACGQRCQFGSAKAGSPAWYRTLVTLAREHDTPLYMVGPVGGQEARLAFVDRGLVLRDDLVGSLLAIPSGCEDPETLMPKGARRDARIGERGGLTAQ